MDERIPAALAQRLEQQYGAETMERIFSGYAAERCVSLRVNRLKAGREAVEAELRASCVSFERMPWFEDAMLISSGREAELQALPAYGEGRIYLQSLSSMLPPLLLDVHPGMSVLDMCAAPGGKTTQIASMCPEAMITACERDGYRMERLKANLQRQGAGRVAVLQADARRLDPMFRFDRILLDAPCTGSGTVDLTPGAAPRRMAPEWIKKTAQTQAGLLEKAVSLLRTGGTLVYSTCSILAEENEEQVLRAVRTGKCELEPIPDSFAPDVPRLPVRLTGTLCVCPTEKYEGFFVAVLRKTKG